MGMSEEIKVNITSHATHRGLEKSTTLNRRYVKRPTKLVISDGTENAETKVEKAEEKAATKTEIKVAATPKMAMSPKISHIRTANNPEPAQIVKPKPANIKVEKDLPPAPNPYQAAIDARKVRPMSRPVMTSRELKDLAIKKALAEMERKKEEDKIAERVILAEMEKDKKKALKDENNTRHLKKRKISRIMLAFAASAACMLALAAIVKINLPNISVTVAAVQTGVDATYPSYVPKDFSIHDVYTDGAAVIIKFDGPNDTSFTLSEEKSSWDSNALLVNYVKNTYGESYDTIREHGITIYINHSNAAWVNNGTFYRITANDGLLSVKQIKNIVGSL